MRMGYIILTIYLACTIRKGFKDGGRAPRALLRVLLLLSSRFHYMNRSTNKSSANWKKGACKFGDVHCFTCKLSRLSLLF